MVEILGYQLVGLVSMLVVMGIIIIYLVFRLRIVEEKAHTDKVTGLWNRHFLEKYLPKEIARAERQKQSLAVIGIDLDGFKQVNDKHGHFAGDACLREASKVIVDCLRSSDIVVRYGGDEFIVIVNASPEESQQVAEKIRVAIADIRGVGHKITASIGIACYPKLLEPDTLIEASDNAMYLAKDQGGNRVIVWGGEHL